MRYDQVYRQAMDKVKASESWKADTRAKMAAAAAPKPRLTLWRRALPVAAAAALCLTAALSLALAGGPSAAPLAAQPAPAAIAPRTAQSPAVPSFDPAEVREVETPAEAAALLAEDSLPETLPVWRQEGEELVRLEDFPLLPAEDALAGAGLDAGTEARLVYVAGGGYILPAWKLETAGEPVYLPAIAGQ